MEQYIIKLYNGVITGNSKVNFFTLISLMDSNVKYSFFLALCSALGIRISTSTTGFKLKETNTEFAKEFHFWLKTKEDYIARRNQIEKEVDSIFPQLKEISSQVEEV